MEEEMVVEFVVKMVTGLEIVPVKEKKSVSVVNNRDTE